MRRTWTRRRLLGAAALLTGWCGLPARLRAQRPVVRIGWTDGAGAVDEGVQLGAEEAIRLLGLLGGTFTLEHARAGVGGLRDLHRRGVTGVVLSSTPEDAAAVAQEAGFTGAVLAAAPGEAAPPAFAVATPPSARAAALQRWAARQGAHAPRIAAAPTRARGVVWAVDWHPALDRNGGAQLEDRYQHRFRHPMSEAAWHGWVAVKAAAEAALRARDGDLGSALRKLTLDAHVGAPLRFDLRAVLVHPLFVVRGDGSEDGALVGPVG